MDNFAQIVGPHRGWPIFKLFTGKEIIMAALAKAVVSVPQYIERLGLEFEGWVQGGPDTFEIDDCGACVGEAGVHMLELVTVPCCDYDRAYTALYELVQTVRQPVTFVPSMPQEFGEEVVWKNHPRYNALRSALDIEVPGQKHRVDQMTLNAALQVNFSGTNIDPFGPSGVFLINLINWLGPLLAAIVHKRIGMGYRHLSIWQYFARKERFPQPDRWFATPAEMVDYIQSLRKLFRVDGENIIIYPEENSDVSCPVDLSFLWWLLRPKLSPIGEAYLEARYLPSMPLPKVKECLIELSTTVETLLEWFYCHNHGQAVESLRAATPAIAFLARETGEEALGSPMDRQRWIDLFNNH